MINEIKSMLFPKWKLLAIISYGPKFIFTMDEYTSMPRTVDIHLYESCSGKRKIKVKYNGVNSYYNRVIPHAAYQQWKKHIVEFDDVPTYQQVSDGMFPMVRHADSRTR